MKVQAITLDATYPDNDYGKTPSLRFVMKFQHGPDHYDNMTVKLDADETAAVLEHAVAIAAEKIRVEDTPTTVAAIVAGGQSTR